MKILKPDIGISEKHLNISAEILSILLADEVVLYTKTRNFHWNVSGHSFMEIHKLFQSQYSETEENIDLIAERINKLGEKTIGTMQEFLEITRLKEKPKKYPLQMEMILELLNDHETIAKAIRKDVAICSAKDIGTADFLTALLEQHETTCWILRRYLS